MENSHACIHFKTFIHIKSGGFKDNVISLPYSRPSTGINQRDKLLIYASRLAIDIRFIIEMNPVLVPHNAFEKRCHYYPDSDLRHSLRSGCATQCVTVHLQIFS